MAYRCPAYQRDVQTECPSKDSRSQLPIERHIGPPILTAASDSNRKGVAGHYKEESHHRWTRKEDSERRDLDPVLVF